MARTKGSQGRRKAVKARRRPAISKGRAPSDPLLKLRKTVQDLRKRLEREAKVRGIDAKALKNMRDLRERALGQISTIRKQGAELARQLKQALSDADKRELARREALAKIEQLRTELARRKEEVARKSQELARLARESAERARTIVMSEAPSPEPQSQPPHEETQPQPGAAGAPEMHD